MTDIELQKALAQELKQMKLKRLDGTLWKNFHVYKQGKPYKDDLDTDEQEDYITVVIADEDTDKDGNMIVEIQMILSIYLYDDKTRREN